MPFTFSQRVLALHLEAGVPSASLPEVCRQAVGAGFGGVELAAPLLMNNVDLPFPSRAGVSPKAVLTGPVAAVTATCARSDVDGVVSEVAGSLRLAGRHAARCLNVALAPLTPAAPAARTASYQGSLNLAFETLHALRFEAEQAGVALALEAGAGETLQSPVELRELVDAAHSWAVGACIDANLIARIGAPEDWIMTLGRRVHSIRVTLPAVVAASSTGTRGATSDHHIDHAAIIRALDAVSFEGVLIVAGDGPADAVLTEARRHGYLEVLHPRDMGQAGPVGPSGA